MLSSVSKVVYLIFRWIDQALVGIDWFHKFILNVN
jgi:hypothetical protein